MWATVSRRRPAIDSEAACGKSQKVQHSSKVGRSSGFHVALRACRRSSRSFSDARLVIDAQGVRRPVERLIAKAIQAIPAYLDGLMAHPGSIPHDVGYLMVTDGSSLVPVVRRLADKCFGAAGIDRGGEPPSVAKRMVLGGLDGPV